MKESVAHDANAQGILAHHIHRHHAQLIKRAHRVLPHRGRRKTEALEIVLAHQVRSSLVHRRHIQIAPHIPAPIPQEERMAITRHHKIAILPRKRRKARGEIGRHEREALHRDGIVGQGMKRALQTLRIQARDLLRGNGKAHHLRPRMHASIGTARADHFHLAPQCKRKRLFNLALHRMLARLPRETREGRAIVREAQRKLCRRIRRLRQLHMVERARFFPHRPPPTKRSSAPTGQRGSRCRTAAAHCANPPSSEAPRGSDDRHFGSRTAPPRRDQGISSECDSD